MKQDPYDPTLWPESPPVVLRLSEAEYIERSLDLIAEALLDLPHSPARQRIVYAYTAAHAAIEVAIGRSNRH